MLTLLIGPIGAGKTTWAAENVNAEREVVLSSDWFREAITGDFHDLSQQPRVFNHLYAVSSQYLRAGIDVIIDATHIRARDRKTALGYYDPYKYRYVILNQPVEDKIATRGWRPIKLIEEYEEKFQSALGTIREEVKANPNIIVVDTGGIL